MSAKIIAKITAKIGRHRGLAPEGADPSGPGICNTVTKAPYRAPKRGRGDRTG